MRLQKELVLLAVMCAACRRLWQEHVLLAVVCLIDRSACWCWKKYVLLI